MCGVQTGGVAVCQAPQTQAPPTMPHARTGSRRIASTSRARPTRSARHAPRTRSGWSGSENVCVEGDSEGASDRLRP